MNQFDYLASRAARLDQLAAAVLLWHSGADTYEEDNRRYERVLELAIDATTTRRASGAATDEARPADGE